MSENTYWHVGLEPSFDLASHMEDLELVSIGLGPDLDVYILMVVPPSDYRGYTSNGIGFAKIVPDAPQSYVVLRCGENPVARIDIRNVPWNFHHVQPLPDGELLLVCARSHYRGEADYDLNAQVFDSEGQFQRSFLLGDGIQDVQTTTDGRIWVSYFDEGVVGTYGWEHPIGARGLVCWDKFGVKQYEYSPPSSLGHIDDCYALNVVSNEDTWCYYYSDYPLVHINNYKIINACQTPIRGSSNFAVTSDMLLMRGGYDEPEVFPLFHLEADGQLNGQDRLVFYDMDSNPLSDAMVAMRDSIVVLLKEAKCYASTIPGLVELTMEQHS